MRGIRAVCEGRRHDRYGPVKLKRSDMPRTPARNNLINSDDKAKRLDKNRKEQYYNIVAKGILVSIRSRPYMKPIVPVKNSNESEEAK